MPPRPKNKKANEPLDYNNVPKDALANEPVNIRLMGKDFPFAEPNKLDATEMLGSALQLLEDQGLDMTGEFTATGMSTVLGASGSMAIVKPLDAWICDTLDLSEADRAELADEFEISELMQAYVRIIEVIQLPFVGGRTDTATATKDEAH